MLKRLMIAMLTIGCLAGAVIGAAAVVSTIMDAAAVTPLAGGNGGAGGDFCPDGVAGSTATHADLFDCYG